MKISKQQLERILTKLESVINQVTKYQNNEVESFSSNHNVVVEHLKDLQHILTVAKKIVYHLLTEKLEKDA